MKKIERKSDKENLSQLAFSKNKLEIKRFGIDLVKIEVARFFCITPFQKNGCSSLQEIKANKPELQKEPRTRAIYHTLKSLEKIYYDSNMLMFTFLVFAQYYDNHNPMMMLHCHLL